MEKTLAVLDTIVDSLRRLQSKVSSLEAQRKTFVTKGELKDLKYNIELKIKELRDELKLLDKKYKQISSPIEDKIKNLENKLNMLEISLSNLVSVEEFSKVNVELFKLSSEMDSIKESLTQLSDLQVQVRALNDDTNKILKQLSKLQSKVNDLEKVTNPSEIKETVEKMNNSLELLSKHIGRLDEAYEEVKLKLEEIERNVVSDLTEDLKAVRQVAEDRFKTLQKEISDLVYLKDISKDDIKKLKQIDTLEPIHSKIMEVERKLNTLNSIINELSKILYQVRSGLSKLSQDSSKLLSIENSMKSLEEEYSHLNDAIKALKKELDDVKDVAMITAKENDRLEQRLSQLETKLKIENIDEVLEAFERVKLIEDELRMLKQSLSKQSLGFEAPSDLALRIKHLESAVKRLYEQQNAILYSLNEKLSKLEKAIANR